MNPAEFLRERIGRSRPLLAEHFAEDFAAFARAAMRIVHPGRKIHWNWTLDYMAEVLMLVSPRHSQISRQIFNTPPRWLKTTLVSVLYPCWLWINWPEQQILCASCEMGLAEDHNLMRRRLISSEWYQSLFADRFKLSEDRNLIQQFSNDHSGAMVACSIAARVLGRGGDTIIIDDPITPESALSDVTRKSTNDWLFRDLFQRQNDPGKSPILLVMQRVHQNDTTGYAMELEPGVWRQDKFSLLAEEEEAWVFPISGRVVKRAKGECLDPKRFPTKVVKQKQLDRFTFASQFQQEPAPLEGNLVRRSDVRYVCGIDPLTGMRDEGLPESFDRKIISVDTSFKDIASADYVAIGVVGVKGRKRYVLNVVNAHLDSSATEEEILRQREIYQPVSAVLVEDKANGSAVIKRLKRAIPGVVAINPEGGKVSRVQAMAPEWQAGDWYVLRNAAWTEPFLTQLLMFPTAKHDDMVDAVSQCSVYLQTRSGWEVGWLAQGLEKIAAARAEHPGMALQEVNQRYGPLRSQAYNVADLDAQLKAKQEVPDDRFRVRSRTFGEVKGLGMQSNSVKQYRTKLPDACPKCGTVAISKYDSWARCACGWDSRDVASPRPEPEARREPEKRERSVGALFSKILGIS